MTMGTVVNHDRALELLRAGFENPTADFRDGQPEAIQAVCKQGSRVLVAEKTGWRKRFVSFIATKLLRDAGQGPALLISPERLNAPEFVRGPLAQLNPSLVVIDEAYCIFD
jgi:superfamily II DNA helicase RecQ